MTEGFFAPLPADVLVSTPLRKKCLKQLWENSSMPADMYQRLCLKPVYQLLSVSQNLPATPEGRWGYTGGFGDLTLQFTTYAVRLARGRMFPAGATAEEQAAQGSIWNMVVFWSALFYHLPLLAELEGELSDGRWWQPGISVPEGEYRFRFREPACQGTEGRQLAVLMAGQLLPAEAGAWLATVPAALRNLAGAIWHQHPEMALIRTVLQEAMEEARSPLVEGKVAELPVDEPVPVLLQPAEISAESTIHPLPAATSPATSAENDTRITEVEQEEVVNSETDADTGMLLALFSDAAGQLASEMPDKEGRIELPEEDVLITETQGNSIPETMEKTAEFPLTGDSREENEFIRWLKDSLRDGSLSVNGVDSNVHFVSGYVFLRAPGIFYRFLKENGSGQSRRYVQSAFERAGIHKVRSGERFFQARLYSDAEHSERYKSVTGYLVKGRFLYGNIAVPGDSPFIVFV
ncbi:TPA: TraI domain-containing protein [Escherichia coli]